LVSTLIVNQIVRPMVEAFERNIPASGAVFARHIL